MSANEITEAVLKNRIKLALIAHHGLTLEAETGVITGIDKEVDDAYAAGKFVDFIGIVAKAKAEERQRAVNICNRHGHRQTAQIVAKDQSDV